MKTVCSAGSTPAWTEPYGHASPRLRIAPCDAQAADALAHMVQDRRIAASFRIRSPGGAAAGRADDDDWHQQEDGWAASRRFNLAAREHGGGRIVGGVRFTGHRIGYFVSPECWNAGYGSEMVLASCRHMPALLGLAVLQARVLRENMASRRILDKAGFVFRGLMTAAQKDDDEASAALLLYERDSARQAY